MCFHEAIVLYLASKLGKPIKVDSITLLGTREKSARVCVEVDLSQQLPSTLDLDLEELPQTMVLVEYEGLHKICFHCGEFGHTEDSCHYKNPGKPISTGSSNAQAMIDLTKSLKPDMAENNMVFGPWMVQQRKPRRRIPASHSQAPAENKGLDQPAKVSASPLSIPGSSAKSGALDRDNGTKLSHQNRFAVIEELMDEELELIGAHKDQPVVEVGNMANLKDGAAEMDATPSQIVEAQLPNPTQHDATKQAPIPPPPLDNSFVKPKSKPSKKKTKSIGPVPKETKTAAQKPYALPPVLKKQMDSLLSRPTTQAHTETSLVVLANQGASQALLPMQQMDPEQMMLPSIQTSDMPRAGNLLPAPNSAHALGVNSTSSHAGQVSSLVATQALVALPPTTSQ
ncbi:hypothetical protein SLA2020_150530 [Shorea laevis]